MSDETTPKPYPRPPLKLIPPTSTVEEERQQRVQADLWLAARIDSLQTNMNERFDKLEHSVPGWGQKASATIIVPLMTILLLIIAKLLGVNPEMLQP